MHHTSRPKRRFLALVIEHRVVPQLLAVVHERVRHDLLVGVSFDIVTIPLGNLVGTAEIHLVARRACSRQVYRGYLPTREIPRFICSVSTPGGSASGFVSLKEDFYLSYLSIMS